MSRVVVALLTVLAVAGTATAQPAAGDPGPVAAPPAAPPATGASPAPAPIPAPAPATPAPHTPDSDDEAAGPAAPPAPDKPLPREQRVKIQEACEHEQPACDPIALLGSYEKVSVARALAVRGLTVDPHPWGKVLRQIHVVNQNVFSPDDGPLRMLNVFHRTTREFAIEREVLLEPGQVWKQSLVDETIRKLHDPIYSVIAVALPIVTDEPGKVDLLIVTRDVWSIRLNSNYEVQNSSLTYLTLSLAENNFLGWRKLTAVVFTMDQGAYQIGPSYIDKNFLGDKLYLIAQGGLIFNRHTSRYEGSTSTFELAQPLWSLDSHWAAGITWTHRFDTARSFRGTSLRTYDDPATPGDDALPWAYHEQNYSLTSSVTRQFPGALTQQVRLGHVLGVQRPSLLTDDEWLGAGHAPLDPAVRQAFITNVLPRNERSSQVFASYTLFTPRYRTYHDIETFDLAEDVQLGPTMTLTGGVAFHQIGSEHDFVHVATSAGWAEPISDGYVQGNLSSDHRFDGGRWIDNYFSATARLVSPTFPGGRVIVTGDVETRWNETQNRFLSVGADSGLRGFLIGQFTGQRRAVGHVELRTEPAPAWFTRAGAILFYDVGSAADSFATMQLHEDVGVGLRILVPQTSSNVLRFDWAFALDGDHRGWPGAFIAGYAQGF